KQLQGLGPIPITEQRGEQGDTQATTSLDLFYELIRCTAQGCFVNVEDRTKRPLRELPVPLQLLFRAADDHDALLRNLDVRRVSPDCFAVTSQHVALRH